MRCMRRRQLSGDWMRVDAVVTSIHFISGSPSVESVQLMSATISEMT